MTERRRVAVLISGRGSNMVSLIAAAEAPDYPARVVAVVSNRPEAAGLLRAADAGIETLAIDHKQFHDRDGFERALDAALADRHIELVCLAGFMRILTPWFVERWTGRMLNVHPSLLPAYRGTDTHARALADGASRHGCTVHVVVPELDAGPIVAQAEVPVLAGDTADTLATRVLAAEHRLYPEALRRVAAGPLPVPSYSGSAIPDTSA